MLNLPAMRIHYLLLLLFLWTGIMCCCNRPDSVQVLGTNPALPGDIPSHAVAYTVAPYASKLAWMARKVSGQHYGTLQIKGGEIFVVEDVLVGGMVEVDMQKLVVLDLTDPDVNQRLTSHLQSGDFFAVQAFPVASFRLLTFEKLPETDEQGNNYKIIGELSIKEIVHTIAINAYIELDQEALYASADFDLDRTLWDIRYRSGRFFDHLGDNLIFDLFNVKLEIVAWKQLLREEDKKVTLNHLKSPNALVLNPFVFNAP